MTKDNITRKESPRRPVPEGGRRKVRKRFRWGRALLFLLLIAILVGVLFKGTIWVYDTFINPPESKITMTNGDVMDTKDPVLNSRINILLLGIDDGDSEAAATEPKRSDAMMVLSIDPEQNKAAVLSLPRDTMVVLPGHKEVNKINAAYAFGGTVMAKQTVYNLLRIPIHYYLVANWRGFIALVDQIGGVDIFVENDMYYEDPYADLVIDIKKGPQHMDGETAGKYVRFRNDELGDIGRVQRQQMFMKAAARQLFSIQNISNIGSLIATLDKYVSTDLNTATMLKAANSFKFFGDDKVKSCMLYGQFADTMGGSYWATTRKDINKSLDELGIPHMKPPKEESIALSGNFKSDEEGADKLQKKLQKVKPLKPSATVKSEEKKEVKKPVISSTPVKSEPKPEVKSEVKAEAKEEQEDKEAVKEETEEVKTTSSKLRLQEESEEAAIREADSKAEAKVEEVKAPVRQEEPVKQEEPAKEEQPVKEEKPEPAPVRKVPTISNEPIRRKG